MSSRHGSGSHGCLHRHLHSRLHLGVSIDMVLIWQIRATTFLTVFCPFFDVMVMFSHIVQLTYIP